MASPNQPYSELYFEHNTRRSIEDIQRQHDIVFRDFIPAETATSNYTMLDIGCGNSPLGATIAQTMPHITVCLLDNFSPLQRNAQLSKMPNLHTVQADGYQLPFKDHSFDLIVATWSVSSYGRLDYLANGPSYIMDIPRCLKFGATAIIGPEPTHLMQSSDLEQLAQSLDTPMYLHRKLQDYATIQRAGFTLGYRALSSIQITAPK